MIRGASARAQGHLGWLLAWYLDVSLTARGSITLRVDGREGVVVRCGTELHPNNLTTEVIEMQGDTGIHQVPGVFLDDDYDDYDTGTQEQGKTAAPKKKNDVNSVEGVEGSLISISAIILLAFILVLVLPYDIHCLQYDTRWPRDLFKPCPGWTNEHHVWLWMPKCTDRCLARTSVLNWYSMMFFFVDFVVTRSYNRGKKVRVIDSEGGKKNNVIPLIPLPPCRSSGPRSIYHQVGEHRCRAFCMNLLQCPFQLKSSLETSNLPRAPQPYATLPTANSLRQLTSMNTPSTISQVWRNKILWNGLAPDLNTA